MIGLGALMGGIDTLSGGSDSTSQMTSASLADRSPVNVSTTGVNLGAMLAPYTQGSPANGGYGSDFIQRYVGGGQSSRGNIFASNPSQWPWVVGGLGLLGATIYFLRRRS